MPRLRQVSRADAPEGIVADSYALLFGDRDPVAEPGTGDGTPGNWWTVCALVPDVLKHAVQGILLYQHPRRVVPADLRELGQIRTGWARGSQFVFSQHAKACRAIGMAEEKITAIPHWAAADCYTPVERAVLAYTDCLTLDGGRVPDGVIEALKAHLSDEQILELTYITLLYEMHATMARALHLEFDERADPIVEVPLPETPPEGMSVARLYDGKGDAADGHARPGEGTDPGTGVHD